MKIDFVTFGGGGTTFEYNRKKKLLTRNIKIVTEGFCKLMLEYFEMPN